MFLLLLLLVLLSLVLPARGAHGDLDGDGISDDMELRLAHMFAPVVHFHPKESFFPTSVETYLRETQLFFQRSSSGPHCLFTTHNEYDFHTLPVLNVSPDKYDMCVDVQPHLRKGTTDDEFACRWDTLHCDLFNHSVVNHNVIECTSMDTRTDQNFYLHRGKAMHTGFNASVPVYVHVHPSPSLNGSVVVQYWFFYPFNGPLDDMLSAGAHEGDWEHISVVLDESRQKVTAVYMAAHSHEASWLTADQVQLDDGQHVHTFVALHSHALYPTSGVKKRISDSVLLSFLHDRCNDQGVQWRPTQLVNMGEELLPLVPWGYYNGYWGSKKLIYSFIPLPFDSASPPLGPMHQRDYWNYN
jgi:hypothetical protein